MTSTTHRETQIVADPDVPLIRITREFDAPRGKVFRAHTDPELVAQWLGPRDLTMTIDHYDCRTGGSYRYVHSQGDEEYGFHGCFHEVRPDELIVQTFTFEGWPDGVALEKLVLEDLGDGRTRLTATSLCDSFADRDAMLSSGMDVGVNEGYAKLDELLARDGAGAR
ncbi:SRPBCC family protein [Blastococcus sp. LR1]|uniref:SRPBCC family protein n=1 Tax=Blastococcus sp. LR1 TaxID=2877000 RepID=UPI001CCFAC60|nr:SRPBCC family protein [Blastococcus sp. LR1]MCA0145723.1 SRPBCC family protein [Blastococcus sp. LR1]